MTNHLRKVVEAIDNLASESQGVAGLHLNGDLAPWDDLFSGGRCEEWLMCVDDARGFLAKNSELRAVEAAAPALLAALKYAKRKLESCARLHGNDKVAVASLLEPIDAAIALAEGDKP